MIVKNSLITEDRFNWRELVAGTVILSIVTVLLSALCWSELNSVGQRFFKLGMYKPAEQCLQAASAAVRVAPIGDSRRMVSRNLATVYLAQDKYSEARKESAELADQT